MSQRTCPIDPDFGDFCAGDLALSALSDKFKHRHQAGGRMTQPLFQTVDCVLLRVANLEEALTFYRDRLGHKLIWKSDVAAGLAFPSSATELVLHTKTGPEVDLLVEDLDKALARFQAAGGELLQGPFELPIGKGAVVQDPFGNVLVLLDLRSVGAGCGDDLGMVGRGLVSER
ncbi:MAG: VOC family protein [Pseudorhizobium sp.]